MAIDIFLNVILPILVMMGLGALIQRFWPMDIATLAKLNIYLFVPAFLFVKVAQSKLSWTDMGGISAAVLVPMVGLTVVLFALMRWRGASPATMSVIITGGLIFNAGNFGIPVAELLYEQRGTMIPGMHGPGDGAAVQALVVMMSNLLIWLIGLMILSLALGQGWRQAVINYLKLPMLYVLAAALLVKQMQWQMPGWLDYPLRTIALGVVPVALVTLGAQLARRGRWPNPKLVAPVLLLKLAVLPAVTAGYVWATGLWPWPGAQLVIASAAPTAVNTLLITLQVKGDADQAADCVFWTTLFSAATVTGVIVAVLACSGAATGGG